MPKILRNRLVSDWKKLWKSYSVISLIINLSIAVSMVGFGAIPAISDILTTHQMFYLVGFFSLVGIIGRFLKQQGVSDV